MTAIKLYQVNKSGIETFAVKMEGENLAEKIGNAMFELGTIQQKWQNKGIRFCGFALTKPTYFYAAGKSFGASESAMHKLRLKFRANKALSKADYVEFASDCLRVIGL